MIYFLFSYLQVLSEHVSNGLRDQGFPHTAATQNLFRLIDKFFDCLNVSNVLQGVKSRKEALHPYRDPNDWRFKVFFSCTISGSEIEMSINSIDRVEY